MRQKIDDKNFIQRALKSYENPSCISLNEFQEDLQRFSYVKKILTQYANTGEINERLLLNHIVICFNLFGAEALLFLLYRVEEKQWGFLFPFLILLNRLPEQIPEYGINTSDVELDQQIINKLRNL